MFGSIGMPELIIILMIALIIFGPRKLPELGRSLGKSINEFKRASNELQSTLDEEIRLEEQRELDARRQPATPVTPAEQAPVTPSEPAAGLQPRHHRPTRLIPDDGRQLAVAARRRIPYDGSRRRQRRRRCRSWSISTSSGSA